MRYLLPVIEQDLSKKMVFVTGPRQCGKTTLAQSILKKTSGLYLNWDSLDHRTRILKKDWDDEDQLLVLDEVHKYSKWKNFLKGVYDTQKEKHRILVTGSARLDVYKKGQDSLLGRFFTWRLHPLCLAELRHVFKSSSQDDLNKLMRLGGFPEPFFEGSDRFAKRWRTEKRNLVFRQDIQELESIREISLLEVFYRMLCERVSSEVVLSNIARDLEIAPKTAKSWLEVLERTYSVFTVRPYSKGLGKAIVKTPKVYLYDNGEVIGDEGARFENLVASHLLKRVHYLQDLNGDEYELNYLRDKNGHEVDFAIVKNGTPICLVEAKLGDTKRSPSLYYYKERLGNPTCVQLVMNLNRSSTRDGISLIPAAHWLSRPLDEDF